MSEISWLDAIKKTLGDAGGALHYHEITERILSSGLKKTAGATPSMTVNAQITASIKHKKEKSPFVRVARGTFALRGQLEKPTETMVLADEGEEAQLRLITSLGMFWRRDAIEWVAAPKLLGMQQIGAKAVDFCQQAGIYLLYDGREVVYVGRSTDRPLGRRLYEHTYDRFSTRWDRFSWFGLRPVSDDGELGEMPKSCQSETIIPALEAVLIEALEPRQNRRRGDDLSDVEYFQKNDPETEKRKLKQMLDRL